MAKEPNAEILNTLHQKELLDAIKNALNEVLWESPIIRTCTATVVLGFLLLFVYLGLKFGLIGLCAKKVEHISARHRSERGGHGSSRQDDRALLSRA